MPEFYTILDPKDVPPPPPLGRHKGPLRLTMEAMEVGDTIAVPQVASYPIRVAKDAGLPVRVWRADGVTYVRRLPDDAS